MTDPLRDKIVGSGSFSVVTKGSDPWGDIFTGNGFFGCSKFSTDTIVKGAARKWSISISMTA
jgi:hypothetical protein